MVFVWGSGRKTKQTGNSRVLYPCVRCNEIREFGALENYRYVHLWGIRVAKWQVVRYLDCGVCRAQVLIPAAENFLNAKITSRMVDTFATEKPTFEQIWEEIVDVAQHVTVDPQMEAYAQRKLAELDAGPAVPSAG
jgi:hypothetical protein